MNLIRQLRGDEGEKATVYRDQLGYLTIGVGRLVDPRRTGSGLSADEIEYLLQNDIKNRVEALNAHLPWFKDLDEARQGVLLNMAFQMGVAGLMGFRNTLAMVQAGEYARAADNMLLSKWAGQTPKRAGRMAEQMRTGVWQYAEGT